MAPLVLEGDTLGQRQRHYNKLVEAAAADERFLLSPINYDDPDVDNLLKIDVACSRRDVEYVVGVLQGDDMLYASRAVKRSNWLITDDKYAHIINPQYLHDKLFSNMITKAQNMLLKAIRRNLKDKTRVDEFFNYYNDNNVADISVSQKWLPRCSFSVIEKNYRVHLRDITTKTFKHLCEFSENGLKVVQLVNYWNDYYGQLAASKVILHKCPEKYLELIKNIDQCDTLVFGKKCTRQIMKNCPEKVLANFDRFAKVIHLPTLAKYLRNDIKGFLLNQAENEYMKSWFQYSNIKHFLKCMPKETRFDFVKELLNKFGSTIEAPMMDSSNEKIAYNWYLVAPFEVVFADIKHLLRVETSAAKRAAMLNVLVQSAQHNPEQLKSILQFYQEENLNEPFKYKVKFLKSFIGLVPKLVLDANTWNILNEIFSSMKLFVETDNTVYECVKLLVVWNIFHNESVPEIDHKLIFDTFKDYRKILQDKEQNILFNYLYNYEMKKLNEISIHNEAKLTSARDLLVNILTLIKEWEKNLSDFSLVLEKIKYLIKVKKEYSLKTKISLVIDVEKKWTRQILEESLFLKLDDGVCVYVLKHDPTLLMRHINDLAATCSDEGISLKSTFRKLRLYWSQSFAEEWAEIYLKQLEKLTDHKVAIEALFTLLPRKRLLPLLTKYDPVENKINWSTSINKNLFDLQKNIALCMRSIRPSVNLESLLSYDTCEYLHFALPSFTALLHQLKNPQLLNYLPVILESSLPLKKQGLVLASMKLEFCKIMEVFEVMWKNLNSQSARYVLFKKAFQLLKTTKEDSSMKVLWRLMSMFIDNLTFNENAAIYTILTLRVDDVPLAVRPQFFMKSYTYMISLPDESKHKDSIRYLDDFILYQSQKILDKLEPSFIENVLLKYIMEKKEADKYSNFNISITMSHVMTGSAEAQVAKLNTYIIPLLDDCIASWKTDKREDVIRNILSKALSNLIPSVLKKTAISAKIFQDIEIKVRTLPFEENYRLITYSKIAHLAGESLDGYIKENPNLDDLASSSTDGGPEDDGEFQEKKNVTLAIAPLFGESCLNYIKQDIVAHLPSLGSVFVQSLTNVFDEVSFTEMARLQTLKHMLDSKLPVTYFMVAESATAELWSDNTDERGFALKREIFDIIRSHPSLEVKICYNETLDSHPELNSDKLIDAAY